MASLAELTDREPQPALSEFNNSVGSRVDDILNKLTGANGQQRYQLWPEKVIRGGLTAAGDALAGNVPQWTVDKDTGEVHTSPQMIEKAQEISALAGTGGLAGADATLGSTAFLRPALKYKDKIYKGKEGQQHLDVIPKDLYPEFEQMAINGEDISHYNFGFMNHKGQFLDREKALKYAIDEGLLGEHTAKFGALTSTLMADSSKPGMAIEAMGKTKPNYIYHSTLPENEALIANKGLSNKDKGLYFAPNEKMMNAWHNEGNVIYRVDKNKIKDLQGETGGLSPIETESLLTYSKVPSSSLEISKDGGKTFELVKK